eukprot:gene1976-2011_t
MLENIPHALGKALTSVRAGLEATLVATPEVARLPASITLTSRAFANETRLNPAHTNDGEGISPPLEWHGVPDTAQELLIFVEDADSPTPHPLVHAIAHGISPTGHGMPPGALNAPQDSSGRNSFFGHGWLPPDPPNGHGAHRYVFQIYALDRRTDPEATMTRPAPSPTGA